MKLKTITSRWVVDTLGVIILILLIVNIFTYFNIHSYYYDSVLKTLSETATSNSQIVQSYSTDSSTNINIKIRQMVENFSSKDNMEMMVLDMDGRVKYTSSGVSEIHNPEQSKNDYFNAVKSNKFFASSDIHLDSGEHVLSYTQIILAPNNEFSAFRYVVSLEGVDNIVFQFSLILALVSLAIVVFVFLSGTFFVNSSVWPVREINSAIKKIASGDMSVRVTRKNNDEIGELCDTINYMADELSNSENIKNEFISSVSHELRTPLTAIQGWSETIISLGTDDEEAVQKGMRVITHETERLSGMVEELLDFSRIQNGRFKIVKDKMDLYAELEEAVLIYTQRAGRDGKNLLFKEDESLPVVMGDKNRIRQVFINIIDNALKYSDQGDTVTVIAEVDEEAEIAIITIEDTGCGIADEDLPRVKEKFYKANNTRRGSGIGLAVATEIIGMHDGTLEIESQKDKGTKVSIKMPLYHGSETQSIEEFSSETVVNPETIE